MEIPLQSTDRNRAAVFQVIGALVLGTMLAACAAAPPGVEPVGLGTRQAQFSNGRVTVVLTDENGLAMAGTRVDFAWERPLFYKTSSFTDSFGRVTFSGVPDVASVSIDHPGGNYTRTLLVPQQGTAELRVILDTFGANEIERARRRSLVSSGQ